MNTNGFFWFGAGDGVLGKLIAILPPVAERKRQAPMGAHDSSQHRNKLKSDERRAADTLRATKRRPRTVWRCASTKCIEVRKNRSTNWQTYTPCDRLHPPAPDLGPKSCCCGGIPHRRYGPSLWTHLANGEGSCPPLCGPDTEQGNRDSPGALLAQPTKGKEGGVGT